jgi:hypothetical protein
MTRGPSLADAVIPLAVPAGPLSLAGPRAPVRPW